jgi:hypothetical protein
MTILSKVAIQSRPSTVGRMDLKLLQKLPMEILRRIFNHLVRPRHFLLRIQDNEMYLDPGFFKGVHLRVDQRIFTDSRFVGLADLLRLLVDHHYTTYDLTCTTFTSSNDAWSKWYGIYIEHFKEHKVFKIRYSPQTDFITAVDIDAQRTLVQQPNPCYLASFENPSSFLKEQLLPIMEKFLQEQENANTRPEYHKTCTSTLHHIKRVSCWQVVRVLEPHARHGSVELVPV